MSATNRATGTCDPRVIAAFQSWALVLVGTAIAAPVVTTIVQGELMVASATAAAASVAVSAACLVSSFFLHGAVVRCRRQFETPALTAVSATDSGMDAGEVQYTLMRVDAAIAAIQSDDSETLAIPSAECSGWIATLDVSTPAQPLYLRLLVYASHFRSADYYVRRVCEALMPGQNLSDIVVKWEAVDSSELPGGEIAPGIHNSWLETEERHTLQFLSKAA